MQYFQDVSRETFVEKILSSKIVTDDKGKKYYNIACAFDIETSSFYSVNQKQAEKKKRTIKKKGVSTEQIYYVTKDGVEHEEAEKHVCCYEWQFACDNIRVYGRYLGNFEKFIKGIKSKLDPKVRLVIYVHNLGYEFQFIRHMFYFTHVFARKERRPMKATTRENIEFRCSMFLTNAPLKDVGHNLLTPLEKFDETYNYQEIRTSQTPLTEQELAYGERDVEIVVALINERIQQDGDIANIPLTSTGYVRKDIRSACLETPRYYNLMQRLTITPDEYKLLMLAMIGGFTHANCWHVDQTLHNVASNDLKSAYPAQMMMQTFPMSSGERIDVNNSEKNLRAILTNYHCVLLVRLRNVMTKWRGDNIISESRCFGDKKECNIKSDNGRVMSADVLTTACTEIDLAYYKEFYKIGSIEILDGYYYDRGYLPKPIRMEVIEYFNKKTELKGIEGEEANYMRSKNKLNSAYGMMVTNIVSNKIEYHGEWQSEEPDLETAISKENHNKNRFLFFPWGVFVTAYTRARVWNAILETGDDQVYTDTDSVKYLNPEKHQDFFDKENEAVIKRMHEVADELGVEWDYIAPKGQVMGVWENDANYIKFKTLGAKRYIYQDKKGFNITIAGCNKKLGKEYIASKEDPFGFFENEMEIDEEHSGRLTHTYIDDPMFGTVTDYLGNEGTYYTRSGVHMEPSSYTMKMSEKYLRLLSGMGLDIGITF